MLTPWNYELFEYNKMMLTYGLTVVIVGAWIVKMIAQKEISIRRTPLDIPIALFFASQLISSLFSMDPHVSWFGYYSRFNGGMFSIISYILLYYAFVSNWSGEIFNLLKLALASATVVAIYAALEHYGHSISCLLFMGKFGVDCWVQDVQNRVFATLGQPNWLAAYLVALLPIAMGFLVSNYSSIRQLAERSQDNSSRPLKADSNNNLYRGIYIVSSFLFFAVLLFTKSRSGLIAFAVADLVFWGFLFFGLSFPRRRESIFNKKLDPAWRDDKKQIIFPFVILHLSLVIIIFFTGTNIDFLDKYVTWQSWQYRIQKTSTPAKPPAAKTDTLLTTGGTESGVIRKYVWEGAVAAWKRSTKTMLIGTGTETFAFAFYQNKPKAHNLTSEWDFLYNKAHNEYLNYLATTGILGLGSYLLFIGVFIFWFFKFSKKEILSSALFAGWLSILITNFFGFSVVIMQLFLFLFPAMVVVSLPARDQPLQKSFSPSLSVSRVLYLTIFVSCLFFLYILSRFWWADTLYNKGYQYNKAGKLVEAHNLLSDAINKNSGEPVYHDEHSVVLAQLAVTQIDAHDATLAAILAKKSLQESDTALIISPNNLNFWKSRTKIFYAFSSFDPTFTKAAIEALQHALILAPTDPKVMYNLAILYGKDGDNKKAIEMLKTTINIKPNYRDAYAALVIFYKEVKQPNLARTTMEEYLTKVDPNDGDFQKQLKAP